MFARAHIDWQDYGKGLVSGETLRTLIERSMAWARDRQQSGPSRDQIIEECAEVAMNMPFQCQKEHNSYRWNDSFKAAAWDISHAIRKLKDAAPQDSPMATRGVSGSSPEASTPADAASPATNSSKMQEPK